MAEDLTPNIKVKNGNNISLIGGDINFNGGGLEASEGNINIVSVGNNENIKLQSNGDWFLADSRSVSNFKDVNLNGAASISVSGEQAGNIDIDGRNIIIDGGSAVLSNTSQATGNTININASRLLEIKGSSGNNEINQIDASPTEINRGAGLFKNKSNFYSISVIGADVLPENQQSQGDTVGNNININAQDLRILDAGQIRTVSFSNSGGKAGNIKISSENILVSGSNNIDGLISSGINSSTGINSKGSSGNVTISTSSLRVLNGGRIRADTFSSGSGGEINIEAKQILLKNMRNNSPSSSKFRTGLSASPGRTSGSGGTVNINSQDVNIENAEISTSSFGGSGRRAAGNTNVSPINSKAAGDININTIDLKVSDNGLIQAENTSGVEGGNIIIKAQNIRLDGNRNNKNSFIGGISSATTPKSTGIGGDINIDTDSLSILNGSIIRAISLGEGDAGNINIEAQEIEISGFDRFAENPRGSERVSKINIGTINSRGGELTVDSNSIEIDNFGLLQANTRGGSDSGGNITINSDNLSLQERSRITASARGEGNGGNVTINSDTILGLQNSDITANAIRGNGGNITINSNAILGLEEQSQLTSNSDITATSEFGIDGTVTVNAPDNNLDKDVFAAFRNYATPQTRKLLERKCLNPRNPKGKLLYVGRSGVPAGPDNFFDDEEIVAVDSLDELSQSEDSEPQIWVEGDPIIDSNAVKVGKDGEMYLVAERDLEEAELQVCRAESTKESKQ